MKTVIAVLMSLALMFTFSRTVMAKTVYLKNGDEIECQNVWKEKGRINVLVNRDTLLDFAPNEVDLDKTFGHKPVKKKIKHHKKRHRTVPAAHKSAAKAAGNTAPVAVKPVPKTPPPGPKGAPPQAPLKHSPTALQSELMDVYTKYQRALMAGNLLEAMKYAPAKNRTKINEVKRAMEKAGSKEKAFVKALLAGVSPKDCTVRGCTAAPDGKTATLLLTGKMGLLGRESLADGTVRFVKEGKDWKIEANEWKAKDKLKMG